MCCWWWWKDGLKVTASSAIQLHRGATWTWTERAVSSQQASKWSVNALSRQSVSLNSCSVLHRIYQNPSMLNPSVVTHQLQVVPDEVKVSTEESPTGADHSVWWWQYSDSEAGHRLALLLDNPRVKMPLHHITLTASLHRCKNRLCHSNEGFSSWPTIHQHGQPGSDQSFWGGGTRIWNPQTLQTRIVALTQPCYFSCLHCRIM